MNQNINLDIRPQFIINHLSERVARKGSALKNFAKDNPLPTNAQTIPVHELSQFETLPALVTQAADNAVNHVFIEGGDGTAQGVLTEFIRQRPAFKIFPKFTLLPGGMTNQVAKNIGLKHASKAQIARIIQGGPCREAKTPLLEICTAETPPYYGFLFSTGAVPMVTQYTKSQLHKRGIGGSLAVAGGIVRGISSGSKAVMHPTQIRLDTAEHNRREVHLGTLVTTLPGLILGVDPFWGQDDAPLRLLYAKGDTRGLWRHAVSLWLGPKHKTRDHKGLSSWNTHHIRCEYDGPAVLDGETLNGPCFKLRNSKLSGAKLGAEFAHVVYEIKATKPLSFVY